MISFRTTGLAAEPFKHLYGLEDDTLAKHGAKRYVVDEKPGYPDRIEMRDLDPGERVILLNYEHQPAHTPYRSSHAIFVREGASETYDKMNEIPDVMRVRPISLRAFDDDDMMIDAELVDGSNIDAAVQRLLSNPHTSYIHAHNAARGCYSGRIERA